jgi:hypothetical protein
MMNTWYRLSLGDGMIAATPSAEIEEKFDRAFPASQRRPEAAVFTRPESEGRLYWEISAYFSPAAGDLAVEFAAEPCRKPERTGLALLAGGAEAWELLFR